MGVTAKQKIIGAVVFIVVVGSIVVWSLLPKGPTTLIIRISCAGSWTGSYGDLKTTRSVEGNSDETYTVSREGQNPWIVTAVFQKYDYGSYMLTVFIETVDGKVLESSYTTAEFGVVTVTWRSA